MKISDKSAFNHIVILGGVRSSTEKIPDLNVRATLVQYSDMLTPEQASDVDRVIAIERHEQNSLETILRDLHRIDPFQAIVSFYETWLEDASRIGQALGVACNAEKAVTTSRDKLALRLLFQGTDLDGVRFRACTTSDDIASFFNEIGGPIIVKPRFGAGSAGVVRINRLDEIEKAFNYAHEIPEWCRADKLLLAEEYVAGEEFSVEAISKHGVHEILAITAKETTGHPSYVEVAHHQPAGLSETLASDIQTYVRKLLDRLGQTTGPTHTEVKIHQGNIALIETQTRFGGDHIAEMVHMRTGRHLAAETIVSLIDHPPLTPEVPLGPFAGVRYFVPTANATVKDVQGITTAREVDGVKRLVLNLKPGDEWCSPTNSAARKGYILAYGDTPGAVANTIAKASAMIKIITV